MTSAGLFLDRDGTIIVDRGYLADPDGVELLDGAAEGLRGAAELGFRLVVVSNQSGVGRGLFAEEAVAAVDEKMRELLADERVQLAGTFYCPHDPSADCRCRKPRTGMIVDAATLLGLDLKKSWMVGDRWSDVRAGRDAGCRTAALGFSSNLADVCIESLTELVAVLS